MLDLQARKRGAQLLLQDRPAQRDAVLQVLERGEVGFERIDMSEVRELLVIVVATLVQLLPAPDDLARLRRQQPGHAAQKAGLADAVRTDDLQQLAALQDERRAAQQVPLAAPQVHGANVELRLGCGRLGLCMHGCYRNRLKKRRQFIRRLPRARPSQPAGVATPLQSWPTVAPAWLTIAPHPLPGWRNW